MNHIKFIFRPSIVVLLIAASTTTLLPSCSPPPKATTHVVKMFVLNEEMTKILLSSTGTVSISNINEAVYKKTTDYEIVGVNAEMNRHPDAKGEAIMHANVVFIRFKSSSKIEMHFIVQPLWMLQQQEWKETLEQLKLFE